MLTSLTLGQFLDALAAKTPAPGGGAVAGVAGATAAALASMVIAYSIDRPAHAAHRVALGQAAGDLARARAVLLGLAEEDAEAYTALTEARRRPAAGPDRDDAVRAASARCVQAPAATLAACVELLRAFAELPTRTNPNLRSDLAIAAALADAAADAAAWNVTVNLPLLAEGGPREAAAAATARGRAAAGRLRGEVDAACRA